MLKQLMWYCPHCGSSNYLNEEKNKEAYTKGYIIDKCDICREYIWLDLPQDYVSQKSMEVRTTIDSEEEGDNT